MEVWNPWHTQYWLAGAIKVITALASVSTAIILARSAPRLVHGSDVAACVQANSALEREIEGRRGPEDHLRLREAHFREQAELLELTDDAIFARCFDRRSVFWNRAAEHRYGWRRQEVQGQTSHDLLQPIFPCPLEEIEKISKDKPDVSVIFANGYSADIALLHRPEIQGLALLQKPHITGDLARRVRETLDHHVSKPNPV